MDLLLSEAARLLDKSESQVRYMIKSGQLRARKADKVPPSGWQGQARARRLWLRSWVVFLSSASGPHLPLRS